MTTLNNRLIALMVLISTYASIGLAQNNYTMYGLHSGSNQLCKINMTNGTVEVIGALGINISAYGTGFDYDPSSKKLHITNNYILYTVDETDGTCVAVTNMAPTALQAIGFDSSGNAYGYKEESAFTQGALHALDPLTGVTTLIGGANVLPNVFGGDLSTNGEFWVSDEWNGKVYRLNLTDGNTVWAGSSPIWYTGNGPGDLWGMDEAPDGTVWVAASGPWCLLEVNTTDGSEKSRVVLEYAGISKIASIPIPIPITDTDGDGMLDEWELEHFGDATSADPNGDPDGDGYTNLEEFQNGGDPLKFDIGSAYIWTAVEVGWRSVAGTNYQVQYTTDLGSGTWKDLRPPVTGNGNTMTFLESIRHEDGRYYRVVVATNTLYDGLVAYYPFNHGVYDETGNSHHGVVHGATLTTNRFGEDGAAYSFDGDDYIDTGLALELNNSAVSVSLWVWVPSTGGGGGYFFGHSGPTASTTDNYQLFGLGSGSSNVAFTAMGGSGSRASAADVPRGEWVHVVAVAKDVPNFIHRLYINGTAYDGGFEATLSTLVSFYIGASNSNDGGTPTLHFIGSIDDVRIYDRVLTSDEVLELRDLAY